MAVAVVVDLWGLELYLQWPLGRTCSPLCQHCCCCAQDEADYKVVEKSIEKFKTGFDGQVG